MFEALSQNQSFMQEEEEKEEVKNTENITHNSRGNLLEIPVLKSIKNANKVLKPKFASATLAEVTPLEPSDEVLKGKLLFYTGKIKILANNPLFRRHACDKRIFPSEYNHSSREIF